MFQGNLPIRETQDVKSDFWGFHKFRMLIAILRVSRTHHTDEDSSAAGSLTSAPGQSGGPGKERPHCIFVKGPSLNFWSWVRISIFTYLITEQCWRDWKETELSFKPDWASILSWRHGRSTGFASFFGPTISWLSHLTSHCRVVVKALVCFKGTVDSIAVFGLLTGRAVLLKTLQYSKDGNDSDVDHAGIWWCLQKVWILLTSLALFSPKTSLLALWFWPSFPILPPLWLGAFVPSLGSIPWFSFILSAVSSHCPFCLSKAWTPTPQLKSHWTHFLFWEMSQVYSSIKVFPASNSFHNNYLILLEFLWRFKFKSLLETIKVALYFFVPRH